MTSTFVFLLRYDFYACIFIKIWLFFCNLLKYNFYACIYIERKRSLLNRNRSCSKILVQGPGYTKTPLGHQVAYPILIKIKISKENKKKPYCQSLNSRTKNSMKNETIKLYNIKFFQTKVSNKIKIIFIVKVILRYSCRYWCSSLLTFYLQALLRVTR